MPQKMQHRLVAILAADMVGYSRLMEADEAGTLGRLKGLRQTIIAPKLAQYGGRLVKLMGDGMLAEFPSAIDAVQCAIELQRKVADHEVDWPEAERIRFRVGVNFGDVIIEEDDLYGDGVNIAARLQELTAPEGVSISAKVHDEVQGKLDVAFEDGGDHRVKNIARPVHVWRWRAFAAAPRVRREHLPLPDKPSIAVLSFTNLSGDPEQEYFSDGISEDIITELSRISGLFVIARNSAFTYKGKSVNVQQVSRELGVRYVLEGSVRKAANRIRITAQLIDGTIGGHLWAERYDRVLEDIFAVQDEVTKEIVAALRVKLTSGEQRAIERRGTSNIEAYDWYLRGREQGWRLEREAVLRARSMLQRAISLDSDFAAPYAMLSMLSNLEYINGWRVAPEESAGLSRRFAQRALELDNTDAFPRVAMAVVYIWQKDLGRALTEVETAISLDPNSALAFAVYASALHYAGRSAEALDKIDTAMRLDPYYPDLWLHFQAQIYFMLQRYQEAATVLQHRLILKPDSDISRVLLAASYGHLERLTEAQDQWSEVLRINPNYSLEHRLSILPYVNKADLEPLVAGLRKAGLPR